MQTNLSYLLLFFCLFFLQIGKAQDVKKLQAKTTILSKKDSISPLKKDTFLIKKKDSILSKKTDTITKDTIKPKEFIEDKIIHKAKDSTIQNAKKRKVTLYNEAQIIYTDIDLKAGIISIDYKKNILFAKGIKDSMGYHQRPQFKQGSQESEQDSLYYNFKTKKALIYGLKTVQGEMITYGDKTKRVNDSTIYIRKIRFTTSQNENPDYYITTNKAKLVPGKKIIVGLSNLVLADVPTPVFLPFAYFPMTETSTSGIIVPSWGENNNQGFFLQNGGYYFSISDYVDLAVTGDVYTNGSWGLRTDSNYKLRYKYSGNLSIRYENIINSIKGFDDYGKSTIFNINWRHSQDNKSNPNSRFNASVNLGSTKYFRQSLNEINNSNLLTNTLNSSISYSKNFVGTPFKMSVNLTHTQNTNTEDIYMTLPSLNIDMDRIYPFAGKDGAKKTPIQKLGFRYTLRGEYRIRTKEEFFFQPEMFRTAKSGIEHRTGTNTNIKIFNYFTLNPSVNYKEVWYFNYITKKYDSTIINDDGTTGAVVTDTFNGFKSFREYNSSLSLSTNIYGTFNFKKGRLKSIRHTFRPSISYIYTPNFASKYNLQVQQSNNPTDVLTYTPFDENTSIYGTPNAVLSNSIGIILNNVLEAKVASKNPEEDEEDKKIILLNNLNFNTTYNFAADSLRWSPVNMDIGTRLFKEKLNINLIATLDPYQVTKEGVRINKFNANVFRLSRANLTANYSISSKDFGNQDKNTTNRGNSRGNETPDVLGANINPTNQFAQQPTSNSNNRETKETKIYKAEIPWTLNLVYTTSYTNNGFNRKEISVNTLMFSGNLELSPKWKIGFASGYDFKENGFILTRLNFSRDLDSWRFNFNWLPFGNNNSYTFFIGVKSSVLRDLKWDKVRPPDRRLF